MPPTPGEQSQVVLQLMQAPLIAGETCFLLSRRWWRIFSEYVDLDDLEALSPGPIDNSELLHKAGSDRVRAGLVEGEDFVIVSEPVWKKFMEWYGGGPALPRSVVLNGGELEVEVFPLTLRVYLTSLDYPPKSKEVVASRFLTGQGLCERIGQSFETMQPRCVFRLFEGALSSLPQDHTIESSGFQTDVTTPQPFDSCRTSQSRRQRRCPTRTCDASRESCSRRLKRRAEF